VVLDNESGQVVGYSTSASGQQHAFLAAPKPDPGRIVFMRYESENEFGLNYDIYAMDPVDSNSDRSGDNLTRLTNTPGLEFRPDVSRNGKKIAFERYPDPSSPCCNPDVYVMDAVDSNGDGNGDNPTRLTNNGSTESPSFSPDGKRITFSMTPADYSKENQFQIYVMDAADANGDGFGDNLTQLTNNFVGSAGPDWGELSSLRPLTPPPILQTAPATL
jgi:Tol biopolymer transport system component